MTLATISSNLWGQHIDSLGMDKNDLLNEFEATYLNDTFSNKKGNFNFEKKKIGFFVGSSNYRLSNKQSYFEDVKRTLRKNMVMQHQLLILNEDEKIESGGYDAFVIAWSKILATDRMYHVCWSPLPKKIGYCKL